ncbi:hypothetical protein CJ030_MR7G000080 [Morella rubra]|uniref:Uncharacterized protein n=1 Tax=Morella rubra TaxID=262757 RepID=A0A6A1V198_9ROSI|nr:hypothetical protein CJ030_MR7G000080 [Morella rubra]
MLRKGQPLLPNHLINNLALPCMNQSPNVPRAKWLKAHLTYIKEKKNNVMLHLKMYLLQSSLMLMPSHITQKKFSTKSVILEREVLLDELTHLRFSEKIVSKGWESLLTKLIPPSEEVVFQSNSTTSLLPYPYLITKFLSSSCITIPRNEPRLKLAQPLGPTTLIQSKSHRDLKKSFSSPSQGPMQSDMSYIVKTLQLLTERSNTSFSVQSSLLATQQTLQLTLSKVLNDVATICNNLNVVGTQGALSMAGGVEDPDLFDSPLDDEDDELSAGAATVHSPSDVDDST